MKTLFRRPGTRVSLGRVDDAAAYKVAFTTSDVATRDGFHASVVGQAKAAAAIRAAFP